MSPPHNPPPDSTGGGIDALLARTPPRRHAATIVGVLASHTSDDSLDWILELARVADANLLPVSMVRECAAELAWLARQTGQRLPGEPDFERCEGTSNPDLARLAMAYLHGQRLKSDYRFGALADASRDWLTDFPDDGMICALAAFGALGSRHEGGEALLARALAVADCDKHCRLVCLQGLWFAVHLPDQPQQMLKLSDELIGRGEDPHSLYYWRASALRRLGRLDDAMTSIDRAIDRLPVGMNEWHQDYVRERELITATRFLTDHVNRESTRVSDQLRAELEAYVGETRTEIERHSAEARQVVAGSMTNLVEVLGIFVAIVTFLVASGVVAFVVSDFWQGLAWVALLLAGAIGFFVLLRFVIRR